MTICVLRCGDAVERVSARRGEFAALVQGTVGGAWGGGWTEHDLRVEAAAPAPESARAFVITGSSSNVTERAPWMLRAEAYVRVLVAARAPVLGICFGHQLVAKALGGEVEKNPRGRELGTVAVRRLAADPLWADLPETFTANASHVESVVALPPGARLLAETDLEPHAAFAIGEHVRCVQFHPEMDGDVIRGYIDARADLMHEEGLDPVSARARAHDSHGGEVLRAFVRSFVLRGT